MEIRFATDDLARLETDSDFNRGLSREVVRSYRKRITFIRAAVDEREFYAMKSLHYEKLKGKRQHQRSMRLTLKWRLVVELESTPGGKQVVVVSIEDYH
jgi:proteic killer suppression protein